MLIDALQFLVSTLFGLAATAFWLRFYMQWLRVPFHNPLAQFIVKVTDFAVRPLRRLVPGLFGLDLSSLLLFLLAQSLAVLLQYWLAGFPFYVADGAATGFLVLILASAVKLVLYVLMGLILLQAVLSWVNPYSPFAPIFQALTRPLLRPLQRVLPPVAGIDLSPLVALILIQLLLVAPVAGLERYGRVLVG